MMNGTIDHREIENVTVEMITAIVDTRSMLRYKFHEEISLFLTEDHLNDGNILFENFREKHDFSKSHEIQFMKSLLEMKN